MYINRKKRSVKWIVDGDEEDQRRGYQTTKTVENGKEEKGDPFELTSAGPKKLNLKFVMNPQGHMWEMSEVEKAENVPNIPIMSPEPIINALNTTKEKGKALLFPMIVNESNVLLTYSCFFDIHFVTGAELFAKRRKKSDKWVIDETNSEQILKSSMKSSKHSVAPPIDNAAIDSISKSINDLKPISSAPEPKPATPATPVAPPNYVSTTKVN